MRYLARTISEYHKLIMFFEIPTLEALNGASAAQICEFAKGLNKQAWLSDFTMMYEVSVMSLSLCVGDG